ncbi:S1C family serine protease [Alicyclobacillus ferrooxydans]|uniref:S1C family serine protease n=1 Tax=Alicyclobacillus ferrooxydans TaxID=471514 RepID=UPI000AD1DAAA|nr:trypsin-like peptidase domain-containing protein [Alicyclobacillus ferrooxydans]
MATNPKAGIRGRQRATFDVGLPNFVSLVNRYKKAVVGIEVTQERHVTPRLLPFGMPWERPEADSFRSINIGTGFIFDHKGYILTNEHVVHGASKVMLRQYGKKDPIEATVVASDYTHDIAILRAPIVLPKTILRVSSQKSARPGEWVVAIGSPLGLDHTVTVGIVSAVGRPLKIGERDYPNLLQTDAAINRGNSGGPLINLSGQVIGMNTAVSQSSQGIGFAIAAEVLHNTVHRILR